MPENIKEKFEKCIATLETVATVLRIAKEQDFLKIDESNLLKIVEETLINVKDL